MQPINQLHVALVFVIICSVHQCTQGNRISFSYFT